MEAHSIRREYTTPYTPEQNSVAERENRTIMEGVRSCLHQARINLKFWMEAVHYLVYTLNRTGTRILSDYTLFEAYFGVPPSVAHLRPFGCPTFVHVPAPLRRKLDPKAQQGIFVGYYDESKAFRVWIPGQSRVVTSRDVTFDEEKIVRYNVCEPLLTNSHSSLIPSAITNVTHSLPGSSSNVNVSSPTVIPSETISSLPFSSPQLSSQQIFSPPTSSLHIPSNPISNSLSSIQSSPPLSQDTGQRIQNKQQNMIRANLFLQVNLNLILHLRICMLFRLQIKLIIQFLLIWYQDLLHRILL